MTSIHLVLPDQRRNRVDRSSVKNGSARAWLSSIPKFAGNGDYSNSTYNQLITVTPFRSSRFCRSRFSAADRENIPPKSLSITDLPNSFCSRRNRKKICPEVGFVVSCENFPLKSLFISGLPKSFCPWRNRKNVRFQRWRTVS